MNKTELSLLLYLETRAVDYGGIVDVAHMNDEDMEIVKRWNDEGFLVFRRRPFKDIQNIAIGPSVRPTHFVILTEAVWKIAHAERIARAKRIQKYVKTEKI